MIEYEQFTNKQKELYDHIMNVIPDVPYDRDERIMAQVQELLIEGVAGAGKTTLVALLVRDLIYRGYKVFMCGPTHKSAQQLKKSYSGDDLPHVNFIGTIHSALGLKLEPDGEQRILKESGNPKTISKNSYSKRVNYNCDILFCDEVSMNSPKMRAMMKSRQRKDKFHIIHIGDSYQLEPADGEGEISDTFEIKTPTKLDEVTRQASDSKIIQFSCICRDKIDYNSGRNSKNLPFSFNKLADGDTIQRLTTSECVEKYMKLIDDDPINVDKHRILSFTNERVDTFNRLVRKRIFGADAAPYIVGEIVIMCDSTETFSNSEEVVITNVFEEEVIVEAPYNFDEKGKVEKYTDKEFNVYKVQVRSVDDPNRMETIKLMNECERENFDKWLGSLAKRYRRIKNDGNHKGSAAGWRAWWELTGMYPNVSPAFAMTVHKSQGSTYDNVIFDLGSTMKYFKINPVTAWRLVYVAATRASKTFYFAV